MRVRLHCLARGVPRATLVIAAVAIAACAREQAVENGDPRVVGVAAGVLPAIRASRIDPATALRAA